MKSPIPHDWCACANTSCPLATNCLRAQGYRWRLEHAPNIDLNNSPVANFEHFEQEKKIKIKGVEVKVISPACNQFTDADKLDACLNPRLHEGKAYVE